MYKFKNYNYDLVIYKTTTDKDFINIQKFLFKNDILWANDRNCIIMNNSYSKNNINYLYIILNENNFSNTLRNHYILMNTYFDDHFLSDYNFDKFIYSNDTFNKFKMIIEKGCLSPTYKSKNIKRII